MTTPDTRPDASPVEQLAALKRQVDDMQSTLLARVSRQPTGDIEPTIRTTPKADTLLMQGQNVNRADYPVLWQWVQDQGLVRPGLFTNGNGTATFGLPDLRGRAIVGAEANRAVGALFGAQDRVITPGNMAAHTHQAYAVNHSHGGETDVDWPGHAHGFGTSGVGDHGFHRPWNAGAVNPVGAVNAEYTNNAHQGGGGHSHSGTTSGANQAHRHGIPGSGNVPVNEVVVGGNVPFNVEQRSISVNWLIWT